MAENKKSFILYTDYIHSIELLSDADAGALFKHLLQYVNDKNPETDNAMVKLAFEPIKQQLKRDLKQWDEIRSKRSEAGKASAEKRKQNQQVSTSVESVQQTSTNPTVTVTVTDTVNVTVTDIVKRKERFKEKVAAFKERYSTDMLKMFFEYWSEHSENGKKMRFEKETVFDISRRLATWANRERGFKPKSENIPANLIDGDL